MARYTGPKHKLARREGVNILEKASASFERRLNVLPGVQSRKGRRKTSEYGLQLREKQKLKRIYNVLEKQFRNYVFAAQKKKESTVDALLEVLESRLDNVVYRLGFAKTRNQARQYVSHGHILVNGKKVDIPSYNVKAGEVIEVTQNLLKNEVIKAGFDVEQDFQLPSFLERNKTKGKVLKLPDREEIANPVDYQLVIEFYSR